METMDKTIKELSERIENKIMQDPGKRGLEEWAVRGSLLPAAESLLKGDHILLATGFYILRAGAIETDGPPGALVLADALAAAGKKVTLIYDDHSDDIMKAGMKWMTFPAETMILDSLQTVSRDDLLRGETSHFIALERPGQAADGCYYNFAAKDISSFHASLDEAYGSIRECGVETIGIGDGGNELGMGLVADGVDRYNGRPVSCRTASDFCICAGVSNWAGYGLASLLSRLEGRNLMPRPEALNSILHSIVAAGAVDGISGKAEITVDGLVSSWESSIYEEMFRLAEDGNAAGERLAR